MSVPARAERAPSVVPGFACEPPDALADSPLADAIKALPRAKQAEIHWRLMDATARGDETTIRAVRALLGALQTGFPRNSPSKRKRLPVAEFDREFGI